MQNIDSLSRKIHADVETPTLCGARAIADYIGINANFTKLLLETETLRGIETEGDWTAEPADLEDYRAAIQNDRHQQHAAVAFGPAGYPRSASFAQ